MILVTGATGQLGKATIENLIAKGIEPNSISALVRDAAKAEDLKAKGVTVKVGDYDNYDSLVAAMKGEEKLLLVSGTDIQNRLAQHKGVIDAAKEAGIKHIVYTSFARKNNTESNPLGIVATAHIETDNYLKASGLDYTIMLNGLYADVLPMFTGQNVTETGIFFPAGEGKTSFTLRADMAQAAATILSTDGHANREYVIAGTKKYSFQEVADLFSEILGKPVAYISPDLETYKAALAQAGVPDMYIGMNVAFGEAIKQGEFESEMSDLEPLLGKPAADLKDFLKVVYGV
jgi:NAD(P)H dehydrogenase (quinone)